jgi:hypothetical protein
MDKQTAPNSTPAAPAEGTTIVSAASGAETNPTPSSGGSFIQSALSALKGASEPNSESPKEPAENQSVSSPTPQTSTSSATPSESADKSGGGSAPSPAQAGDDDEGAKADADIKRETANMTAAHRAAFTKLRYEARDLKRQLKAAQTQQDNATTSEGKAEANDEVARLKAEYDALKSKVDNYEKEAYTTRLESTELYQKEVSEPRQSTATAISQIADRYGDLDKDAVIAAVRSGDPEKVSRVTSDMSEYDRYRFYNLVEKYHQINAREDALKADSKSNLERYSRELREKEEARRGEEKSQWEKAIGETWQQLEEDFPVLSPVDGDEDWNEKLTAVKSFAAPDRYEKLTVRERAEALYRAAAFPVLAAELESTVEELKAAQAKLSKYAGATPGLSASGGGESAGTSPIATGEGAFVENALNALRKVGSR